MLLILMFWTAILVHFRFQESGAGAEAGPFRLEQSLSWHSPKRILLPVPLLQLLAALLPQVVAAVRLPFWAIAAR